MRKNQLNAKRLFVLAFGMTFSIALTFCQSGLAQDKQPVAVQLVDSDGVSINGDAVVWWYYGSKGKKLIPENGMVEVLDVNGFLVARHPDFRFSGMILDGQNVEQGETSLKLIMTRPDQPGRKYSTQPLPFDKSTSARLLELF